MRSLRRFLGALWALAAAVPFAARPEGQALARNASVSVPTRGQRPDSRPSLTSVRIGLGESVLRDLKTPFVGTPTFRLDLTTRITRSDGPTVRPSDGQAVRQSHRARAPPAPS